MTSLSFCRFVSYKLKKKIQNSHSTRSLRCSIELTCFLVRPFDYSEVYEILRQAHVAPRTSHPTNSLKFPILLHYDTWFELQQVIFPMFIYLNAMSYCHVICWLDICANEQFISWLYVNARNWLNKHFLKYKMQNMFDIFDIIKLETKIGSTCYIFVQRRKGERMVSICMVPTVKHGWGGLMVWGCLAGDTIGDLFITESILNQHDYHSILQRHAIPSC